MPASFLDLPSCILQRIVLIQPLFGSPQLLHTLLLTCVPLNLILDRHEFYLQLFATEFDIDVPAYILGESAFRRQVKRELQRRWKALALFKRGAIDDPFFGESLWIAAVMLGECGVKQRNLKQLLWADLPQLLHRFLLHRLYTGSTENDGWPLASETNSLVIALSWGLSSQCTFPHG